VTFGDCSRPARIDPALASNVPGQKLKRQDGQNRREQFRPKIVKWQTHGASGDGTRLTYDQGLGTEFAQPVDDGIESPPAQARGRHDDHGKPRSIIAIGP
jgi:hypothetical protein